MGKKSRRPNRNKLKGTAAASATTVVAAPAALERDQLVNQISIINQLFASGDGEGLLQLESTVTRVANEIEKTHPLQAGECYYYLGTAHKGLSREGGIDQEIVCYQKAIERAKQASNKFLEAVAMWGLADSFVWTGRIQEAMDLHKSLVDDIGKERLDPNCILEFAHNLKRHHEFGRELEVLQEHLDVIESTWDKPKQAHAYGQLGYIFVEMYDYNKSNVYFERELSIAKEMKDLKLEANALRGLGDNHRRMGNYDKAMEFLEQGLVPLSETGDIVGQGRVYSCMGEVLLAQDGREQEAIEIFLKAYGILETCDGPKSLGWILCKLGEAFRAIEAWDDAITALEKSISISAYIELEVIRNELQSELHQVLGRTYLEQYYSDESLVGMPETREGIIHEASFCSQEAINLRREDDPRKPIIYLDLAQEHYFLGDTENAQAVLTEYFDRTVKLGPKHCQMCHQACPKDAHMEKCSVCKVARYCSRAHSIQAWQKDRLCHKVMCPLLKRWRRLQVGEATTDSCNAICNDFFELQY